MVQQILVLLILLACIAYAVRRLWKRFHMKCPTGDVRCAGCPLADSCCHKQSFLDLETSEAKE